MTCSSQSLVVCEDLGEHKYQSSRRGEPVCEWTCALGSLWIKDGVVGDWWRASPDSTITLSANHDHRHVRSSRWSLRWNPILHRKAFRQSTRIGLFLSHVFKTDPCRKTPFRTAADQRGSALDKRTNCRRLWISLHKGFSRYCIPPLNRKISYKTNLIMCNRI